MNDHDTGPRPNEALHEVNASFAEFVSEQLGIPVSLGTLRYGYRRGTQTPNGRVRLGVWKFGRQVVTSLPAVRRWAEAVAAVSAEPIECGREAQAPTSRRVRNADGDRVAAAEQALREEGLL